MTVRATAWVPRVVLAALFASAIVVLGAQRGSASVTCEPVEGGVLVSVSGEAVRLSIGGDGVIYANQEPCDAKPDGATVDVVGSTADETVTIDQSGTGGQFPPTTSFSLDLTTGTDELQILLTDGTDDIVASSGVVNLYGAAGGPVVLDGVDRLVVSAGAGSDTVDLGQSDIDLGPLSLPVIVFGGDGDDTITGSSADDRLYGQLGSDHLDGRGGSDLLVGGGGDADACWYDAPGDYLPCEPGIELSATLGSAGDTVAVAGFGWWPESQPVSIAFGNGASVDIAPRPDGTFTRDFEVPPHGATDHVTIAACQPCGDEERNSATATFTYAAVPEKPTLVLAPDHAAEGQTVTVSGTSWPAGTRVDIFIDPKDVTLDEPVLTMDPGGDGVFTISYRVKGLALGLHEVLACQSCGTAGAPVSASLTVEPLTAAPVIRVQPRSASPGDLVSVAGSGWTPALGSVTVTIRRGTTTVSGTSKVRDDGTFRLQLSVPDIAPGNVLVAACQRCGSGPKRLDARDFLTVAAPGSPPWGFLGVVLLIVALSIVALGMRARWHGPKGSGVLDARLEHGASVITVRALDDGTMDHVVRLSPHADAGTQRIEELIE
jgi:RTX calcium-binding nonapeptide repeat (4 copies)